MNADRGDRQRDIDACMAVDRHRFSQRAKRLAGRHDAEASARLDADIEASCARRAERFARRPIPTYPDELPVVQQREEILRTLDAHQVMILCGETGSGKTTQLPKLCLELGRGSAGQIGHTQPRRIAARSVAARIASELETPLGEAVGYRIRFGDRVSEASYVKLMTDGILLNEIRTDRFLNRYDTLIIDEAHERSLNIDFLLGYLKRLLPKRPDLKLIVTSATIDPERFSAHFDGAPIVTAEGRSYPVEIRYQPPDGDLDGDDNEPGDTVDAVVDACDTLLRERQQDVLVFLPGEREIRELADRLARARPRLKALARAEVLPLFSRLSNAEQNRIFEPHSAPRIVLATNVAETSLTVPGIRSVIDTGLARVSRYSLRSQVQRLPIEKISQASANQRAGRCGRVAPGVCIRLYDEADFEARREFTEPEILRTNLAAVILQMTSLGLGDVERFPFLEPPDSRLVNDGYRTLAELAAIDTTRGLTPLGRRLARLPIDPRLARMLLAGGDEGAVREVLTIVSALAVQDPRDRPFDKREAADTLHAEFADERSDFLGWLALWDFLAVQREALSGSKFRKMCRQRFLSAVRVFEWLDVRAQLERLARELELPLNDTPAEYENVHRALLTGLLANVAVRTEGRDYLGTRNRHQHIFPGSALARKAPKWIMSAEVVETSRLFAREVAGIDPTWIERLGAHLLKRTHRDPHWLGKQGRVGAYEQSTLYGLVVNPKKRVDYTAIDPVASRAIFIRDGLVGGGLRTDAAFLRHNLALLEEVGDLEEKTRRRDIVVEPETMERFYDARIPSDICTARDFDRWRERFEREQPRGLYFSRDLLVRDGEDDIEVSAFPDQLDVGGLVVPLRYRFAPGEDDDGVTLSCPVEVINRIPPARLDWLVPGLLEEKVLLLIKGLPKALRRHFVPAPDFARAATEALAPSNQALADALARELARMTGVEIAPGEFATVELPVHLRMRIELLDRAGRVTAVGRDLAALQARFEAEIEENLVGFGEDGLEREAVERWNFGDLPERVDLERAGVVMQGWPALERRGDTVGIRVFASEAAARRAMPAGLRGLYRLVSKQEVRYLTRKLPGIDTLALRFAPFGSKRELIDDIIDASIDATFIEPETIPRTQDAFERILRERRGDFVAVANGIADDLSRVFEAHRQVARRMDGSVSLSWVEPMQDMRDQIDRLLYAGFVRATGRDRLRRLPVYFQAMDKRLDAIDRAPDKDRRRRAELLPVWEAFKRLPESRDDDGHYAEAREALRWSFEELRVSLFAQELGTREKVSVSRLEERLSRLAAGRSRAA